MARCAPLSAAIRPRKTHVLAVVRRRAPSPKGKADGVEPVVDHPGDGDVGRAALLGVGDGDDGHPRGETPVEVGELVVERAVDRGHDGKVRDTARRRTGP